MMIRFLAVLSTLLIAALAACGVAAVRDAEPVPSPPENLPAPVRHLPARVTGIVSENLNDFDAKCSCRPDVAVHYVRWGEDPATSAGLADGMLADGATPLLEIEPYGIPLAAVLSGSGDSWLSSYAAMVRSLRVPVLLSFAPEANGDWYGWGWKDAPPSTEVAAWRHVVAVFRKAGASNARWVWITNQVWAGSGPLPRLWPGSAWVNEIGVDGYFRKSTDTFSSVFGPTIGDIRGFAPREPVLITETGASPQAGKTRAIGQLEAGTRKYGLGGFVWFDISQSGPGEADWSLDVDTVALAAFRAAVKEYGE